MNKIKKDKGAVVIITALLALLTLYSTAYADDTQEETPTNLQINVSWGGGDILQIEIVDRDTNETHSLSIRLSDHLEEDENPRYIYLQAMDILGERQSGLIQIENPLFVDPATPPTPPPQRPISLPARVQDTYPPATLTPDGTGTVVDNIMTINDIEFFTVDTADGSNFFLVIDRQRAANNVYLLSTVTEAELVAFAEARGDTLEVPEYEYDEDAATGMTMEDILYALQQEGMLTPPDVTPADTPPPAPAQQGINTNLIIFIAIIAGLIGVFIVFKKVIAPKLSRTDKTQHDFANEEDDDDEEPQPGEEAWDNFIGDDEDAEFEESEANKDEQ